MMHSDLTDAYNTLLSKKSDVEFKITAIQTIGHYLNSDPKHKQFLNYILEEESNTYLKRKINKLLENK